MKKLFLVSFALFLTVSAFSQSGKVISAYNYLSEYNQPTDGTKKGDAANLEEAAKNIDIAVADPSTSGSSKAWSYRAKIYQTIGTEPSLATKFPTASLEAVKSYQKLVDLNDPKFKDWSDVYNYLQVLGNNIFNDGVTAYQKKNYHNAYLFFNSVSTISDIMTSKGQKFERKTVITALSNAGLSAEYDNDSPDAIAAYKKILTMSDTGTAKVYVSLISLYKKSKDTASAQQYTDLGLEKYPSESQLLIDKINFFISANKYADAISYLQKAIMQDPKNDQLQGVLGLAYNEINDTVNARKAYENALVLNPNSMEANRGLGAMLVTYAKNVQNKMNSLGESKEDNKKYEELTQVRNAYFLEAKPYLEKVLKARPDDDEIKKVLNTIEAKTRK